MFEFRLPDIGEGVVEGEVVKWHVKQGDTVREDQPMVEVMTDKATVEIPSPKAGVVKEIRVLEGKTCAVGSVMVVIDDGGVDSRQSTVDSKEPQTAKEERQFLEKTPKSEPASVGNVLQLSTVDRRPSTAGGKVLATPATRKLARDLGVDLQSVHATGPNGRVTHEDVRAAGNASNGGGAVGASGGAAAAGA